VRECHFSNEPLPGTARQRHGDHSSAPSAEFRLRTEHIPGADNARVGPSGTERLNKDGQTTALSKARDGRDYQNEDLSALGKELV